MGNKNIQLVRLQAISLKLLVSLVWGLARVWYFREAFPSPLCVDRIENHSLERLISLIFL